MLLGIAIANITTAWVVFGSGTGFGMVTYMAPEGPADQIVGVFNAVFIHMRGLPMFATLFGYGIGMVLAREARRGTPFEAARKLIQRRYLWLALFGLVHTVFLFFGDIMLSYSLAGIFISLTMLRASDKALLRAAGIMFGIGILFAVALVVGEIYLHTAYSELLRELIVMMDAEAAATAFNLFDSYLGVVVMGLLTAIVVTVGFFFFFLVYGPLIMLGFVAGRRQLLSRVPANHRLLVRISVIGFPLSILGGLVAGLLNMGVVATAQPWLVAPHAIAWITGAFGGVATIALIALACQPLQERIAGGEQELPLPVAALQALGERSMSGYLFQSFVFISLLPSFTLGLMANLTLVGATALAAGVWLVSVIGAYLLARAGRAGPAETLHRRLTYRSGRQPRDTRP